MKDRETENADNVVTAAKHFESQTLFGLKIGCKNPEKLSKNGLADSYKTRINLEESSL